MKQFYDVFRDGVTQSVLSTFMKCRQHSKLSLDGWSRKESSPSLQFGTMTHNILEKVYGEKKRDEAPTVKEIERLIDDQINNWFKNEGIPANDKTAQQLEFHGAKLSALLPEYFVKWGKEDFKKIQWIALEKEFTLPIQVIVGGQTRTVTIRGKRDGEYKVNPNIYLFETKTKAQIDEGTITALLYSDFQTNIYSLALKHDYGKYPKGTRYNILRNPGSKPHKGEDLKAFSKRLQGEIQKDRDYYFIRYQIYKPKSELISFQENDLQVILQDFVNWRLGDVPTYKNTTACMGKYGACSMLPICFRNDYRGHHQRKKIFSELSEMSVA